jgi:hypothetical protein
LIGLPLSRVSRTANSRERSCRIRAIRKRYFPRSAPLIRDHTRVYAVRAAFTARSTSSVVASATSASTSSVAGLIVCERRAGAVDELAVDEQAVGGLQVDDGPGLGGRGVVEGGHVRFLRVLSQLGRRLGSVGWDQ